MACLGLMFGPKDQTLSRSSFGLADPADKDRVGSFGLASSLCMHLAQDLISQYETMACPKRLWPRAVGCENLCCQD